MVVNETVAVILNGDRRDYNFLRLELRKHKPKIICADGGLKIINELNKKFNMKLKADLLVGDMDSISSSLFSSAKKIIRKQTQDCTDGELALREAIKLKPKRIFIYCGFGTRHDHEHANIAIIEQYLHEDAEIKMVDRGVEIFLANKNKPVKLNFKKTGNIVSLLPVTKKVEVDLRGFKWKPENGILYRCKSTGMSNILVSKTAGIKVKKGILKIVLFKK